MATAVLDHLPALPANLIAADTAFTVGSLQRPHCGLSTSLSASPPSSVRTCLLLQCVGQQPRYRDGSDSRPFFCKRRYTGRLQPHIELLLLTPKPTSRRGEIAFAGSASARSAAARKPGGVSVEDPD